MRKQVDREVKNVTQVRRDILFELERFRDQVRRHLNEFSKAKCDLDAGVSTLDKAWKDVEKSCGLVYSLMNAESAAVPRVGRRPEEPVLVEWIRVGMKDPRIKAIVGVRGSNKSAMLHAIHGWVLGTGVSEDHVVIIDFEDARFRRFKTARDVIAYLDAFPKSDKPYYLFLDEVDMISYHSELLRRLHSRAGWNVWMAASTSHVIKTANERSLLIFRAWTNPAVPRSRGDLEKYWCQAFMRDVPSGMPHFDIRTMEMLAEYFSDHLGELCSLRQISEYLTEQGRPLARSSVSAYRQALADAYLIEISEVYDTFEGAVVKSASARVFFTDLEMRSWRYGPADEKDPWRVALNRFYLELRRKYGKVYTPRDHESDFVTVGPRGKLRFWSLPKGAESAAI